MKKLLSILLVLMVLLSSIAAAEVAIEDYGAGISSSYAIASGKKVPVEEIQLKDTELTLKKGKTYKLKYTVLPKKATNKAVKWKTSNKKVATVDSKGKIKAVGYGSCEIKCSAKDGSKVFAVCVVNVPIPLNKAKFIGNNKTMVFHRPACRMVRKMLEENKVAFLTRDDALEQGYKACKVCYP